MLNFLCTGRKLVLGTAVNYVNIRTESLCTACSVHCNVSAAYDDRSFACVDRCGAVGLVRLHEVNSCEELVSGVNAVEVLAGDIHETRKSCARADEYGLIAFIFHEFVNRDCLADNSVCFDIYAKSLESVYLLLNDRLGKSELGDPV